MVLQKLRIVHAINMIAAQNDDVIRADFFDRVDVLIDRVRSAEIPIVVNALFRRPDADEFAEFRRKKMPSELNVALQACRFVLRHDKDFANPAVQTVRQCEINDSETTAKRHRRFTAVSGKWFQPGSPSPGQHHS